jgi:hypothetical protein
MSHPNLSFGRAPNYCSFAKLLAANLLAVLVNDLHSPDFGIIDLFEPFFNLGFGALSVMGQPMLVVSCNMYLFLCHHKAPSVCAPFLQLFPA